MNILVSTSKTQGTRRNDFCFVPDAEPVMFGCECSRATVDDHCGCKRSMAGVLCSTATTTVMVFDDPEMTQKAMEDTLRAALTRQGWIMTDDSSWDNSITHGAKLLLEIAAMFAPGTILERRGRNFKVRKEPKPPRHKPNLDDVACCDCGHSGADHHSDDGYGRCYNGSGMGNSCSCVAFARRADAPWGAA